MARIRVIKQEFLIFGQWWEAATWLFSMYYLMLAGKDRHFQESLNFTFDKLHLFPGSCKFAVTFFSFTLHLSNLHLHLYIWIKSSPASSSHEYTLKRPCNASFIFQENAGCSEYSHFQRGVWSAPNISINIQICSSSVPEKCWSSLWHSLTKP